MKQEFSPSPWENRKWDILAANKTRVASVIPWDDSGCRKEDIANVNVITAAPELYQELRYAVECVIHGVMPGEAWLERVQTVINKVEKG